MRATGTDHTGAVTVVLGPGGFADAITIEPHWHERIAPTALDTAIGEAFTAAMRSWTAHAPATELPTTATGTGWGPANRIMITVWVDDLRCRADPHWLAGRSGEELTMVLVGVLADAYVALADAVEELADPADALET